MLDFKGYLGWENGLKEIMRRQHIAVVPSRSEGTPRVILECMSQGVCMIASNVGGIPSVVKDGYNGCLIQPGEAHQLREKILMLAGDENLRRKLILRGFETSRSCTLEIFVGHFKKAIEAVSNEHKI